MSKKIFLLMSLVLIVALSLSIYFNKAEAEFKPEDLRWHVTIDGKEHILKPLVMKDNEIAEMVEQYHAKLKRYNVSSTANITAKFPIENFPNGMLATVTKNNQLVSNIPVDGKVTLDEESGTYYLSAKAIYSKAKVGRQVVLLFGCIVEK